VPYQGLAALLLVAALFLLFQAGSPAPPRTPPPVPAASPAWSQVYMTQPQAASARNYRGGPDEALARALDDARTSVDMAAYHLNLWSLRDALLRAHWRRVPVRLVIETDQAQQAEVRELQAAGIPVAQDGRSGLMHHKFVVIDGIQVWTGSMNLTVGAAYRDHNNLLALRSQELAVSFTREFEEMFLEGRFGPSSRADTPHPTVMVEGTRVDVIFSPDDGVLAQLLALVQAAARSVRFMAFSFTSPDLAQALLERSQAGLEVRGVFDAQQARGQGSAYPELRAAGLEVRLDSSAGNMHHKVIVIDEAIVVTGSYNFSRSAEERNDENVVIVFSPELAGEYLAEFERLFAAAEP
jgi:phosphatidylserine/phosphatidylglycerophosphate/cardiolipin synthase-like enzyme